MAITLPETTVLASPGGASLTYVDASGALRIITFDCTVRVMHVGTAVVTEHPVDAGANITDNIRAENRKVTLEVEVTNTPLLSPTGKGGAVGGLALALPARQTLARGANVSSPPQTLRVGPFAVDVGAPAKVDPAQYTPVQDTFTATVLQFASSFDRVLEVWEALDDLRVSGTLVSATTRIHQYDRCAIVSVSLPEEAPDAVTFTIDLVETRVATSETIDVQPPVAEKRAVKKTTAGTATGYLPPETVSSGVTALLESLPDGLKSRLKGF